MAKAKVGMRVFVYSPDQTRYLGQGTITKVEPLIVDGEIFSKDYPAEIKLDNGTKRQGLTCWWVSIDGVARALRRGR